MIIVYHHNNQVDSIFDFEKQKEVECDANSVIKSLFYLAESYENRILVWCHIANKNNINFKVLENSFIAKNTMISYGSELYIPKQIGYVEDTPFIKVNTNVKYPTWLMSSNIGAIYSNVLLDFKYEILNNDFDYNLNSIAKLGMPNGLFCYSDPNLLLEQIPTKAIYSSTFTLFKFVKQHYKTRWIFLLVLNYLWHEKKLNLFPFIKSWFYKKRTFNKSVFMQSKTEFEVGELPSIDVIIPTIGRKKYLYDVLKDLKEQTHLPKQVIVIEQYPEPKSRSELDYIETDTWPFKIIHRFIQQTGVCNARNLALKEVNSDYVYLADDDNRFNNKLLETALSKMIAFNLEAISMSYLQKDEKELRKQPIQWYTFGAGSSIIKSKFLKRISFDMALEFGYGEDVDFGMQLRNVGADIIYMPNIKVLHLKAPIGGFRSTFKQPWLNDKVLPKPSPTVMLNRIKNTTEFQLLGYKTILCINYYFTQKKKNPISYFKKFKKQWNNSVYWAQQLQLINK